MNELADGHPFLEKLQRARDPRLDSLDEKIRSWQLGSRTFYERLHDWFDNFDTTQDQELALRLILSVDYYNESRLEQVFKNRLAALTRKRIYISGEQKNAVLVMPGNKIDSAYRHGWLISKLEGLAGKEVLNIAELTQEIIADKYLVFINDTHGSGDQFLRDNWSKIKTKGVDPKKVVIVAIAIAQQAHKRYKDNGFVLIPEEIAKNAHQELNKEDFDRITQLGKELSPDSPLGYGETALLVAYHFQCPNNTLPLLWSKGSNQYRWNPLFEYREKVYPASGKPKAMKKSPDRQEDDLPGILRPAVTNQPPKQPIQATSISDSFDVFLSHNSQDKPIVRELAQALELFPVLS